VDPELLFEAAGTGDLDRVKQLARDGALVNWADAKNGLTALIFAAANGHVAVVQCLVKELNAAVNQADKNGDTPLLFAAQGGHIAVVRCLAKELNADVNQPNKEDDTPLSVAAYKGHVAVVRCLVKELNAAVNQAQKMAARPCTSPLRRGTSRWCGASARS